MSYSNEQKSDLPLFEKFYRYNSLPVILTNPDTLHIIEVNNVANDFFGLSSDELINTPLSKYAVLPEAEFNTAVLSFVRNNYSGLELTFRTHHKGDRDIELHYTLTDNSQLLCVLVEVTDRNYAIRALKGIKENLSDEVKRQTTDLVRINNSLIEQIRNRRLVEEELRQSQEMFVKLFQLNPIGMVLKRIDTSTIEEVNQSFLSIFNLQKQKIKGKSILDLHIICNPSEYLEIQKRIIESSEIRKVSLTMSSHEGHVRFILFSGEIINHEQGNYILEFYEDITENQIIQERLALSEERYRTMHNNAIVGIYRAESKTGFILSSNLQFAKMLGYKSEKELIGKSILKHYPKLEARDELLKKLNKHLTTVFEYELISNNGKRIWVVNYARLYPEEAYLDGVVVDITDRKVMENLLIKNENRFRSMTENASDIILIIDNEGNTMYLSPSINKELGYDIYPVNKVSIFDFIHPNDKEGILTNIQGETSDITHEVRVKHKNDTYKTYEYTATNLIHDPSVGGIIINAHDITAKVKAREEINQMLQKEQELSRQKTQFISTVSHEFRTPLTNISLNVQLLEKYVKENRNDKVGDGIARMNNAVKRLTSLLNEVSLISKDQSGRLEFAPEEWCIHTLIDELMDQISYLIQPNIKILINKGSEQNALADKNLISHILTNLASNAIKYSHKEGEVFISVKVTPNDTIDLEIKDKGIGIPEGEIIFLFDPYFRASNAKQISGTGIGLSIVKRCVDLHKGSINIKSRLNEGTTINCSIPLFNATNKIHRLEVE